MGSEYISATKVADLCGRHVSTVYDWCKQGKVEYIRIGSGGGKSPGYWIKLDSLRAFLGDAAKVLGV